ncbi:MAG: DNA polymerase III subunit alpha [Nitrospiraceae bacterium]
MIHLHVHSDFSPMRGVSSVPALTAAVRAQGGSAVALTDTNGLYGAIRFVEEARRAGLRPVLGAELVTDDHRAVLLAKTTEGYANLCRILSARHCEASFDFIEMVTRHRTGLIILTDDEPAIQAWSQDSSQDLYVELTPGPAMHDALAVSRRLHLPPVATNRVHFIRPDEFSVHRLLRTIALNTTLSRLPIEACCAPTQWLMPPAAMRTRFPHVPEAIDNTVRIADACHTDWNFRETIFPAFRRLSNDEASALLREKSYAGACRRYGTISTAIRRRLEHELALISHKRFAHYFLIVDEIVRQAPRTCGRGSVAASIVSYCLDITHVDPIRHNLFFERFLNPGRKDPPDIDIDFPWDERDDIIKWVFDHYGTHRAAMVANQNTLGLRAAFREVAKVHGIPPAEIGRVSSLIMRRKEFLRFDETPTARMWADRLGKELRLAEPWPLIIRSAVHVQNHFRHLSVHCGGVVIVPDEIRRYVPVEIAAKGVPVIQWEKDQTEDAGLVKIDLLGNRSLAVIRDALNAIALNTGRHIDYAAWDPLHDPATQALITQGDTIGCFYIESPATRLLLKKLWGGMPAQRRAELDVFDYLVMVSSLVRPAANHFVDEFIRRAQGKSYDPWHPRLTSILKDTHGIMVYQEDVTKVAMALADFSIEDADQLRKVLSKKHKAKQLRDYYRQFCEGAAENGVSARIIALIWDMIMSFAGYSFCKPHSASYAQVSFKSAYLRAHYPAEFIAAVISNQGGFYSTFAYLSEARRMGLAILLPDVNMSEWTYTGRNRSIRIGLMQIKTLPESLGKRLIEERNRGGRFRSFQDFLDRVKPDPADARTLVRAGCCDSLAGDLTRPALLWRLYADDRTRSAMPIPDEYAAPIKLAHERDMLGLLASRHPLELYDEEIRRLAPVPGSAMARYVGRAITMVGWLITEKFAETKHGLPMEFATFEDTTALYDATLFPEVYQRCCHLLSSDHPYLLRGLVEEQFGVVTLTVHDLRILPAAHRASDNNGLSQSFSPWYGDTWDDECRTDPPPTFCRPR